MRGRQCPTKKPSNGKHFHQSKYATGHREASKGEGSVSQVGTVALWHGGTEFLESVGWASGTYHACAKRKKRQAARSTQKLMGCNYVLQLHGEASNWQRNAPTETTTTTSSVSSSMSVVFYRKLKPKFACAKFTMCLRCLKLLVTLMRGRNANFIYSHSFSCRLLYAQLTMWIYPQIRNHAAEKPTINADILRSLSKIFFGASLYWLRHLKSQ